MNDTTTFGGYNQILQSLPGDAIARLEPHLQMLDMPLGAALYNPYEPIENVYFPVTAMASIVAQTSTGQSTEIGVVGFEGAVGQEVVMGAPMSPHKSMMQMAGKAYRLAASVAIEEFQKGGPFHDAMLNFVQKLSVQVSQTTLCNRLHLIDARLPRWLLMVHDRVPGDTLMLTQEFISLMLGTSRVTVTHSAKLLQANGCIKYVRGRINILDRKKLEELSCDCYRIVKTEYERAYSSSSGLLLSDPSLSV